MKSRDFLFCSSILATIYICGTLLYYSQIYLLYNYFDPKLITSTISGWAYIAQAIGLSFFILMYRTLHGFLTKRVFPMFLSFLIIPISCISLLVHNGNALMIMVILFNGIIGIQTAFTFSLISTYIDFKHRALCFGTAYSVGGLVTWCISSLNIQIMTTYPVLLCIFLILSLTDVLLLKYKDIHEIEEVERNDKKDTLFIGILILLMSVITTLGSNDPILVELGNQTSFLTTRIYYAIGLMTASYIFDLNNQFGGICTIASLLYPILVTVLYREIPNNMLILGLTDTFAGFFTVYRAGMFLNHPQKNMASLGLCISRITEGLLVLLIANLQLSHLAIFLTAGITLVPIIILYGLFYMKEEGRIESKIEQSIEIPIEAVAISFSEKYNLTRREEEILDFLVSGKTNKEIADNLCLSESTVRFHVSNILKKTGYKSRNDVKKAFKHLQFTK